MAKAIREFYEEMGRADAKDGMDYTNVRKIRMDYAKELVPKLKKHMQRKDLAPIFGVLPTTTSNWCTPGKEGAETPPENPETR